MDGVRDFSVSRDPSHARTYVQIAEIPFDKCGLANKYSS